MDNITIILLLIGIFVVLYGIYTQKIAKRKWNESYRTILETHEKERIFPIAILKTKMGKSFPWWR